VTEYLAKNGYRRTPRLIRTLYYDFYSKVDDFWYGLTDYIKGRSLQYTPSEVLPAVRNLSQLHEALQGFEVNMDRSPSTRSWDNVMDRSVRDMHLALQSWEHQISKDPLQ